MWIRTQDKTRITKATEVYLTCEFVYVAYENDSYYKLGMYEDEKRAMEVLNEIHTHILKDYGDVYQMPDQ